jgi:hypothetical protein
MAAKTNLPAAATVGQLFTSTYVNDLRGAFRILQVVSGSTTTAVTTASTSYVDTNLTATITPQSTSSQILVYVSQGMGTNNNVATLQLLRGATNVCTQGHTVYAAGILALGYCAFTALDSPATTSATTYKTQIKVNAAPAAYAQYTDANGTQRSTIILMEVSA